MSREQLESFEVGDRPELFKRPAIFLSASVPHLRDEPKDLRFETTPEDNHRWVESADPALIRNAVVHLCRFAFGSGFDLVFGGHPAITPMVLEAARRFGGGERPRVVVFQSLLFLRDSPPSTLEFETWNLGNRLWTAAREPTEDSKEAFRKALWPSLTHMRRTMIASPNLRAAVFIGGMDGLIEEEDLWRETWQSRRPAFAIGSTGGMASDLLAQGRCHGHHADLETLGRLRSYPLVMSRILQDLQSPTDGKG